MKKILIGLLLTASLYSYSPKQKQIAEIVWDEWSKIEVAGKHFQSTGVAIAFTESSFAKNLIGDLKHTVTKASLGVMQNQCETTRFMGRIFEELSFINRLSDRQLINKLLVDHRFNARVAAYYFKWNYERFNSYKLGVAAHNGLPKGKMNWPYYNRVMKNKHELRGLLKELKEKKNDTTNY